MNDQEYTDNYNKLKTIKFNQIRQKTGANSLRSDVVHQLCMFMENNTLRFKYWLGRTRHLKPGEIYDLIKQSEKNETPQRLFNYLLKKSKGI